jgi:hypothetical protein
MDDLVDPLEGGPDPALVADVADDQLDLGIELGRTPAVGMDLGDEAVQRPDPMAALQQGRARCRPTKPAPPVIRMVSVTGSAPRRKRSAPWRIPSLAGLA